MSSSSNPSDRDLLEVGRIEKVHGLRGEVVVGLVSNMISARTEAGTEFWSDGRLLKLLAARPHKHKWLMSFDGVTSREDAEGLRGLVLTAEPLPADAATTGHADGVSSEVVAFVHELIGRTLVDQDGVDHGPVVAVVDNPASDLLELEDGRLVPLSFYQGHDDETVTVDVPPGLLTDLDDADRDRTDPEGPESDDGQLDGGQSDGGQLDGAVGDADDDAAERSY